MKNRHLASLLFGAPLAIDPLKLDAILAGIGDRFDLDIEAGPAPTGAPVERRPYAVQQGVAVINVMNSLSQRTLPIAALSGLTSYAEISAELAQAVADEDVKAILMRFDSPGGEVAGMFDLADQIAAVRGVKPIYAIAEDKALSAAYCLAAACDKLFVTQSGDAGSIGVIATYVDTSMADAQSGRKVTTVFGGARKLGGPPGDRVDVSKAEGSAAWKAIETRVGQALDLFVSKVAGFRGMTQDAVRGTEAGVYRGKKAVDAGLADGVASFSQVLSMLADDNGADLEPDAEDDNDGDEQMQLFGSTDHRMSRPVATAPSGAHTEVAMGDLSKKDPAVVGDGGAGEVIALKAKLEERERELAAVRLESELREKAVEAAAKAAVIKKHQDRGALVPAMLPTINALAEVKSSADLDKLLAAYPAQFAGKSAPTYATPEAAIAAITDGPAADAAKAGEFQLDAAAKEIAKQFRWSEKDLARYANVRRIRVTEAGSVAEMQDGSTVLLKDLNAGRA